MAQFVLTATKSNGRTSDKATYEVYARHRAAANSAFFHFLRGRGWSGEEIQQADMREATPEERAELTS